MKREWQGVLRYAGPMILAEGIGTAVPVVVIALIGWMGDDALYVRSLFMPVVFAFIAVQISIAVTTQVAVALGAGRRYDSAAASAWWLARVGFAATAVVSAVFVFGAPLLADLLSVRPDVREQFEWFVRWVALAQITGIGPVVCAAVLRGAERPRSAAALLLTAGGLEVVGVALLGLPGTVGWGLWSVPVAIAASGVIVTAAGCWLLWRVGLWRRDSPVGGRSESTLLKQVGVPVGAAYGVIFGSNFALTWVVSVFGAATIAGFAVAYTLQTMIIVPGMAIGSATAIVVNQCRGREEFDRLRKVVHAGLAITGVLYALIALVCWSGRDWIALAIAQDPGTASEAASFLAVVAPTYLFLGVVLASLSVLEQTGAGALAVILNATYFGLICVIGGYLARGAGDVMPLYQTMAFFNLLGGVVVAAVLWHVRRLQRTQAVAESPQQS
ncbi:MATE family efflux transporter [Nocardiopsis sp. CNT312]|uniref:MATE family efflux transporter n=1 Tax=Nocardiopsis sp. CNT312 TaxID=1137268 RepID=UPI0004AD34AE|nr:MATE family efflux transporter [Nocardiopsis sp. CNT312]